MKIHWKKFAIALMSLRLLADSPPLLFQQPTLSRDFVVFVYAGDLWRVPRSGGDAVRLTTHSGREQHPTFSPDGKTIAFTGEYDGNADVYLVPVEGGIPFRLTSHPGADVAVGWTPDGKRVLFRSARNNPVDGDRLFTVSTNGGPAAEIPLPLAEEGSYSPDSSHLAYVPQLQWQRAWKRYHGGQTKPIWIANLADSSIEKLPRENSNDFNPLWVGETIFFLSDRLGPVTLFAYDLKTRGVREVVKNNGLDFKSAGAGPEGIVCEQFGRLLVYDLGSSQTRPIDIRLTADFAEVRPHFKKIDGKELKEGRLSPTGQRAVFEVRGEILTVPAEKGETRNLTRSPAVADRDPAWSPDGKWIAYFSDASGEYALHLQEQSGAGELRKISLGQPPSFFYSPVWSPDSKHIAFSDKRQNLWGVSVEIGTPVLVDTDPYIRNFAPSWSPDSRWIAYGKTLLNRHQAVFLYSLTNGIKHQVTDGLSDTLSPQFSDSGQYLYFAASTDNGPTLGWGDLSAINHPVTRSLYLLVLDKTLPSPFAMESDEEKVETDKPEKSKQGEKSKEGDKTAGTDAKPAAPDTAKAPDSAKKDEAVPGVSTNSSPVAVRIDLENLDQRIVAVPMPAKNYLGIVAGKSNSLWVIEGPTVDPLEGDDGPEVTLHKFDLSKRKSEKWLEGIKGFSLADKREKLLYQKDDGWFISGIDAAPKPGEGGLKFADVQLAIDPRAEWKQMYDEVWRIERDFFYDPHYHGLDLAATAAKYRPYLNALTCRFDLNYLFEEMLGELSVGHMFVGGGDMPSPPKVKVGLLGADFTVENGRYRISRILNGENWNPDLRAPLTEPGVNVAVGDYLLAVDGVELTGNEEIYARFQDKAERATTLRVGPNPDGTGARDVKLKPVADDHALRYHAWIEDNRRTVDRLSNGKIAYVHVPDTAAEGYTSFNRYFFAQIDKSGFVIDERYNHGGLIADYVVDYLRRTVMNYSTTREGEDLSFPLGASPGPKVMLINEFAGSGGDALPWLFRKAGVGTLVGKRTWGGLIGIGGYPPLLDGGHITAPHWAIYGTKGEWEVENVGIAPDVEVEYDPKAWREGHDLQLEKAVAIALESLAKNPPVKQRRPAYPNYHSK